MIPIIKNPYQHFNLTFAILFFCSEIEIGNIADAVAGGGLEEETFEEALPLHGDKLFHAFLTRLQQNPEQILRYVQKPTMVLLLLL